MNAKFVSIAVLLFFIPAAFFAQPGEIEEIPVTPYKKDILIEHFGVAWYPYWQLEEDEKTFEVPGFTNE